MASAKHLGLAGTLAGLKPRTYSGAVLLSFSVAEAASVRDWGWERRRIFRVVC